MKEKRSKTKKLDEEKAKTSSHEAAPPGGGGTSEIQLEVTVLLSNYR